MDIKDFIAGQSVENHMDRFHNILIHLLQSLENQQNFSEKEIEQKGISIANSIVHSAVENLFRVCLTKKSLMNERKQERKKFEKYHYKLWRSGLDLLDTFIYLVLGLGEEFNSHYRPEAAKHQEYRFDVLTKLHARAICVSEEILTLLRSGYADGAHARWRTLYELSVIANFISPQKCDNLDSYNDLAKRYLEHEIIESYRAMRQYQEKAEQLDQDKFSEEQFSDLTKHRDKLCNQYGETYDGDYGWATKFLGKKKVTFADIESATEMSFMRPYYKMASHNIHAGVKGVSFRLGVPEGMNILLAGYSNYGLAEPAQGTARSLKQTTTALFRLHMNIDATIYDQVLSLFVDEISKTFVTISENLDSQQK